MLRVSSFSDAASLLDEPGLCYLRALAERFARRPGEYRWEHRRRCREWDAWIAHVIAEQLNKVVSIGEARPATASDAASSGAAVADPDPTRLGFKHAAAAAVLWVLVCVFSGEEQYPALSCGSASTTIDASTVLAGAEDVPEELRLPRIAVADRADDALDTSAIVRGLFDLDVEMETLRRGGGGEAEKYFAMAEFAWSTLRECGVHDLAREDFAPHFERWLLLRYDAPEPARP